MLRDVATIISGDFEWNDAKAALNLRIHGVSFDEAITVFEDIHHCPYGDGRGNFMVVGFSDSGRLLTVVNAERGERVRIISAWRATRAEQDVYRERTYRR